MTRRSDKLVVFVATPLEEEQVERIRRVDPERVEVIYETDLLPPVRYPADHNGVDSFRLSDEQATRWRAHLARADVSWDFPPDLPDGTSSLSLASNLKWIQTTSSGVGQRVKRLGLHETELIITTARGIHAGPLAEFVFLALLSQVKRLARLQRDQSEHRWERFCGDTLEGKTLGVIGAGGIGRRVAAIGRCFGMKLVALSRPGAQHSAEELGVDELLPADELPNMLSRVDALVLSVPMTSETAGMIDRAALSRLRPGAILINIARGGVIDEPALIDALKSGKIAFAALDVFAQEPLPTESPLWDLDNVLVSPHSASTVIQENARIADIFCHNLRCYLDDRIDAMRNLFDKNLLY